MSTAAPSAVAASVQLQPVAAVERVALLDVLRGFTLYGVLLANMVPWFSGLALLPRAEVKARMSRLDEITSFLMRTFVDGKAMGLLLCLFGVGFALQLARAEARGAGVAAVHLRRMASLFILGVSHVLLIWWGDILTSYALAGVFLLLFRKSGTRALLLWATFLILVPALLVQVPAVAAALAPLDPHAHDHDEFQAQVVSALRGHDRAMLVRMQVRQAIAHVAPMAVVYFPWVLGRLLLGYTLGRSGALTDPSGHLPFFRRLLRWGLGVGLTASIALAVLRLAVPRAALPPAARAALVVVGEAAVLGLVGGYMAALALLMERPAWRRRVMILAPVGRMALTTYVTQSLLCTFVFYGWGLGLLGRVGPAAAVPLSLGIFAAQVVACGWWMRRFRFGPLEWVWRSMTYGRLRGSGE